MPRYWFTTHWPRYQQGGPDTLNVYIQDQFKAELEDIRAGDKLFVYEFKSGPDVLDAAGEVLHRRQAGRQGIVCEADIVTELHLRPGYSPEHFEGRGKKNFCWQALTENRAMGFVSKADVCKILSFEPGYQFFGFNGGRGIMQISADQYAELHSLLTRNGN